jgi:hypothetical protein
MDNHLVKGLTLTAVATLIVLALSASVNAGSLRQGSTEQTGAVSRSLPSQVFWTYYQTILGGRICKGTAPEEICDTEGEGDNVIRLVNPNGAGNTNLAGAKSQAVCAMLYVFDADQEMGECCGCPLSSTQLATFSVQSNLTSNWELSGGESAISPTSAFGSIAVVATTPNTVACSGGGGGVACNGGCDPTNVPGYSVTTASNLLGSVTHSQTVFSETRLPLQTITGITEVPLFDNAGGDPTNLIYLQTQCGALVGNGTQGGICNCPTEG